MLTSDNRGESTTDNITRPLNELAWPTLQDHRKWVRLVLLYKIVHNLLAIPYSYFPEKVEPNAITILSTCIIKLTLILIHKYPRTGTISLLELLTAIL